ERPVGHGEPDVVETGDVPPREVGPVVGVDDLHDHWWQGDGGQGGVAHGGAQPVRQVDQPAVAFGDVGDVGAPFDVEAETVETLAVEAEVPHRLEAAHV